MTLWDETGKKPHQLLHNVNLPKWFKLDKKQPDFFTFMLADPTTIQSSSRSSLSGHMTHKFPYQLHLSHRLETSC